MKKSRTALGVVWLTLVAFGLQLAISVSHHHRENDRVTETAGVVLAEICEAQAEHPCSQDEERYARHAGCVLCWAASVAANALEPPHWLLAPIPTRVIAARLNGYDMALLDHFHRDQVRARGPPVAPLASNLTEV